LADFRVSGPGWSHDVAVGPLAESAAAISAICGNLRVPLVTDKRILELHARKIEGIADFQPVIVPEGEAAKSWDTLRQLTGSFVALGVTRQTPIVAFGGGSVGDVAGLAAALFKRGCPVIQLPTTLLAQVDSAIGGKTAIDAMGQKNLVGAFHPPALVVCNPAFLDTLDERHVRAGYAEVVKYGLIDDPAFFAWCEDNGSALIAGDAEARMHAISHCVRAKASFVAGDLRDQKGTRALLNLGHSFGHAIEALAGPDTVLHGEAVSVGMTMAFRFSAALELCPEEDAERVRAHLAIALPTKLADLGLAGRGMDLLPLIAADKKAGPGRITLILARGIGRAFVERSVDERRLAAFLQEAI
jgi:3-dehydroquinate synthase